MGPTNARLVVPAQRTGHIRPNLLLHVSRVGTDRVRTRSSIYPGTCDELYVGMGVS